MTGMVDKVRDFFGMQRVDDYDDDTYYSDYEGTPEEDRYYRESSRYRATDDYAPRDPAPAPAPAPAAEPRRDPQVVRIRLTNFLHARQIGEAARKGDIVVYDLSAMAKEEAQRVVDFASGIQIALEAKTKRLQPRVIVLIPKDIDLDDDQLEQIKNTDV